MLSHRIYCLSMSHIGLHGILWEQPITVEKKIVRAGGGQFPFEIFFFFSGDAASPQTLTFLIL